MTPATPDKRPCNLCGDTAWKVVFRFRGLQVARCPACGFHFVVNPPALEELSPLYHAGMYEGYWKYDSGFYARNWQSTKDHTEDIMGDLETESLGIERYFRRGRILDIGCFKGHFLRAMAQRGWQTVGVDISADAIEYGKKEFGLDLYCQDVSTLPCEPASFDVATMWGVIEHLTDPARMVASAAHFLKTKGLFVVKTQNQDSLLTFFARTLYALSLGTINAQMEFFYSREHLCRFSPRNLSRLLEKHGFAIDRITYDSAYIVKYALQNAKWHVRLPVRMVEWLSRVLNKQDKMTVYAVKQ